MLNTQVTLAPTRAAASRTKNRIRENGPAFIVRSEAQTCHHDRNGELWIRFESVAQRSSDGKGGKEAWHGWLPASEIEVNDENR
jgi:hypothetical protein